VKNICSEKLPRSAAVESERLEKDATCLGILG